MPALAALVAALASSVVLTLAGCASRAGIVTTALPFSLDQLGVAGAAAGPAIGADWWPAYAEPELTALVERALAGNPGLKVAAARLARAEAGAQAADAALGPQVNATLDLTQVCHRALQPSMES